MTSKESVISNTVKAAKNESVSNFRNRKRERSSSPKYKRKVTSSYVDLNGSESDSEYSSLSSRSSSSRSSSSSSRSKSREKRQKRVYKTPERKRNFPSQKTPPRRVSKNQVRKASKESSLPKAYQDSLGPKQALARSRHMKRIQYALSPISGRKLYPLEKSKSNQPTYASSGQMGCRVTTSGIKYTFLLEKVLQAQLNSAVETSSRNKQLPTTQVTEHEKPGPDLDPNSSYPNTLSSSNDSNNNKELQPAREQKNKNEIEKPEKIKDVAVMLQSVFKGSREELSASERGIRGTVESETGVKLNASCEESSLPSSAPVGPNYNPAFLQKSSHLPQNQGLVTGYHVIPHQMSFCTTELGNSRILGSQQVKAETIRGQANVATNMHPVFGADKLFHPNMLNSTHPAFGLVHPFVPYGQQCFQTIPRMCQGPCCRHHFPLYSHAVHDVGHNVDIENRRVPENKYTTEHVTSDVAQKSAQNSTQEE